MNDVRRNDERPRPLAVSRKLSAVLIDGLRIHETRESVPLFPQRPSDYDPMKRSYSAWDPIQNHNSPSGASTATAR